MTEVVWTFLWEGRTGKCERPHVKRVNDTPHPDQRRTTAATDFFNTFVIVVNRSCIYLWSGVKI